MRYFISAAFFIILFSCNEKIFTAGVDCSECYDSKSDSVDLIIDFTFNDKYTKIPWKLYIDEVEKDIVDWVDTAYSSPVYLYSRVDQKYSIKAEYAYGNDTIYVIDATTIKWKRVTGECDDACYVIVNERIDARLKY
ncbi:MAG: hypothetical protein JXB00_04865 [Bacteroidales bacterium]|nr:hypothetical protein [Bacteroidales bacterium]